MDTNVHVTVIKASDLKKEGASSLNAYVEVKCGELRGTTRPVAGTLSPTFNEMFKFPFKVGTVVSPITFRVYNDKEKPDLIGEATANLQNLTAPLPLASGKLNIDLCVSKKLVTGKLQIEIKIPAPASADAPPVKEAPLPAPVPKPAPAPAPAPAPKPAPAPEPVSAPEPATPEKTPEPAPQPEPEPEPVPEPAAPEVVEAAAADPQPTKKGGFLRTLVKLVIIGGGAAASAKAVKSRK